MTRTSAAVDVEPQGAGTGAWAGRVRAELIGNVLPFWPRHVMDRVNGGFYGAVTSDLVVIPQAWRASVINSRILWTYSTAARLVDSKWRETADWAFDYLACKFWDDEHGGLYWTLDHLGRPVSARKQTYAQAFGIYALAEYHRATGNAQSLELAKGFYRLVEAHCADPVHGGYLEARGRRWEELDDVRLSEKDLNCPKSMNTHLHVLEAYTNLVRVWPDADLKARHRALIGLMMDRIIDSRTGHLRLFFDMTWRSLSDHISFGHDIEASWLLVEAAEVQGEPELLARARSLAVLMAAKALEQGIDRDGSMFYEADRDGGVIAAEKHWWVQAESVVGLYNAFQIAGEERFHAAAERAWSYIENHVVDRVHGEWHAKLNREGLALTEAEDAEAGLVGLWKCPYHNARVCFEMLQRLGEK